MAGTEDFITPCKLYKLSPMQALTISNLSTLGYTTRYFRRHTRINGSAYTRPMFIPPSTVTA
ncbi:MAG: hypothetical protein ABIV21_00080 [Pyrinomonadaceae bacterium]